MIDRIFLARFCLAASLLLLRPWPTEAQAQAAASAPRPVDAKAMLITFADFLSKAGQFSVTIRIRYDVVQKSGQKIEFGEIRKVALRRPDRFRSDFERSDGEKGLALFDGKEIVVFSETQKVYAVAARPGDTDGAVTYLLKDLKMRLPLAMMYLSRLPAELAGRIRSAETVEQSIMMDVPCTHLAARGDDVDVQLWIPSQGDPLHRRIVITYKRADEQPEFRADFSDWNLSPEFPEGFFTFSPGEGTRQIPFLAQLQSVAPANVSTRPTKRGASTR